MRNRVSYPSPKQDRRQRAQLDTVIIYKKKKKLSRLEASFSLVSIKPSIIQIFQTLLVCNRS